MPFLRWYILNLLHLIVYQSTDITKCVWEWAGWNKSAKYSRLWIWHGAFNKKFYWITLMIVRLCLQINSFNISQCMKYIETLSLASVYFQPHNIVKQSHYISYYIILRHILLTNYVRVILSLKKNHGNQLLQQPMPLAISWHLWTRN